MTKPSSPRSVVLVEYSLALTAASFYINAVAADKERVSREVDAIVAAYTRDMSKRINDLMEEKAVRVFGFMYRRRTYLEAVGIYDRRLERLKAWGADLVEGRASLFSRYSVNFDPDFGHARPTRKLRYEWAAENLRRAAVATVEPIAIEIGSPEFQIIAWMADNAMKTGAN